MIEQSIQKSTDDGYKSAFRQYLRFCNQYGEVPSINRDENDILDGTSNY